MTKVTITTTQGDKLRADQAAAASNPLNNLTLAQALTWIDSNLTDLASAKVALKQIVKALFMLQREVEREVNS
jgi:hypothetical protein